jgi:hypothetical protein
MVIKIWMAVIVPTTGVIHSNNVQCRG